MWLVIQHVGGELSTTLSDAFRSAGIDPVVRSPYLGDELPDAAELTGLVVLGAPHGSADDDTPHLGRERALLKQAAYAEMPVLGICFGSQLLSVALGGSVRRAANPESGPSVVHMTAAGSADPVLGAAGPVVPVMQRHADEFTVPQGSEVLATGPRGEARAFRYGRTAYGLQFHAEVDTGLAAQVASDARVDFEPNVVTSTIGAGRALLRSFVEQLQPTDPIITVVT